LESSIVILSKIFKIFVNTQTELWVKNMNFH